MKYVVGGLVPCLFKHSEFHMRNMGVLAWNLRPTYGRVLHE